MKSSMMKMFCEPDSNELIRRIAKSEGLSVSSFLLLAAMDRIAKHSKEELKRILKSKEKSK